MVLSKLLLYELRKIPFVFVLFSLLIVLTFKGVITFTYYNYYNKEWRQTYYEYLAYTTKYDINDAEKRLNGIRAHFNDYSVEAEAIDTLLEQLKDYKYCELVQKVAQKESGFAFNMPSDFNKLKSVYAAYDLPDIANVLGYRLFPKLNEVNFIPIIIILAFSSLFSIERETGMMSILRATGVGWGKIFRSKLALTIGISTLAFNLFYIVDLIMIFAVSEFGTVSSPYRSIISTVLTNDSIGTFIIKYYIIGMLYTVFMSFGVLLFSSLSRNSRLAYAINGLTFIAFTIIGVSIDKLGKAAVLITGDFIKLFNETSLIVVANGPLIIEQYIIILLFYAIVTPFIVYTLRRTS